MSGDSAYVTPESASVSLSDVACSEIPARNLCAHECACAHPRGLRLFETIPDAEDPLQKSVGGATFVWHFAMVVIAAGKNGELGELSTIQAMLANVPPVAPYMLQN